MPRGEMIYYNSEDGVYCNNGEVTQLISGIAPGVPEALYAHRLILTGTGNKKRVWLIQSLMTQTEHSQQPLQKDRASLDQLFSLAFYVLLWAFQSSWEQAKSFLCIK